jgi:glyoxylase-like metal-dependent hydrolase (beta-lactamase superfamily II)
MLTIKQFVFNPFEENTYIIVDSETNNAVVVDPGMFNESEQQAFDKFVADNNIKLNMIVNTHLHLDHSFSINYIRQKYGIKLAAHIGDSALGRSIQEQGMRFGFFKRNDQPVEIDVPITNGDVINVGNGVLNVLHVPGHSQGGVALYAPAEGFVLAGDSLFRGSIGRTDLPGGNHQQLIESIHNKLLSLPDGTTIFPGHGPHTTVVSELAHNPYL